jgi:RNA polymerase sigma factor (sigma-70 family)
MGRDSVTDAELIEASRRGERQAFGQLVERYQNIVCAVSYSRTGDAALSEDVAQETFIAAWRQLDQLRETVRLRAWLCGIARNLAGKARRKSDREQPVDPPPKVFAEGANPFDVASKTETERVVRDALARVPETYREVLVLYYHEQRSAKDVADALGISEAAAMQRLSRGRQYLADGVTDLVERALRGSRAKKGFAAAVVAVLPALAPSRVEAATPTKGWTMLKLVIAAIAAVATGTTAYVVHSARSADDTPVAAAAPTAAPIVHHTAPSRVDPPRLPTRAIKQPSVGEKMANADDERPAIDRKTIDRLHLYRGPSRGPADAPVTIVVFTDLKCPYCAMVLGTLDQLTDEYAGKVRLVVKQFPVHQTATLAAEAVVAADAQGKFWELHDRIMAHQGEELSRDAILAHAKEAGLDVAQLTAALDNHTYAAELAAQQEAGKEIDVNGTPTFVINGKRYSGARPIEFMREAINGALASP